MRNLTLFLLPLLLCFQEITIAQEFSVTSFKNDLLSTSARRYGRKDKNNKQCAILKINTRIQGVKFECPLGITGNPALKTGETWLYISPLEKKIHFTKDGYIPKDYFFPTAIEEGSVYIMSLGANPMFGGPTGIQPSADPGSGQAPDTLTITAQVKVPPTKGALFIKSTPSQASIYIDTILRQLKTPLLIENLTPGIHQVRLHKQGFSDVSKTITIFAGKTSELNEVLPPPIGISINSNPPGAGIFMDGHNFGYTPAKILLLRGNHNLVLSYPGYYNHRQTIFVSDTLMLDTLRLEPEVKFEMILVEGGTFSMGSEVEGEEEKPVHTVSLDTFYLSKYEVTQQQWFEVMGSNPAKFNTCKECPVESVSWDDIREFLQKLNAKSGKNYRLPTEAEWEFAARGGNKSKGLICSGSNKAEEVAWLGSNSGSKTHPVGQKLPNELGLHDMSGNVWEWCCDLYDETYYQRSPVNNPKGSLYGTDHILRGGSWLGSSSNCHAAGRHWEHSSRDSDLNGFRLALIE